MNRMRRNILIGVLLGSVLAFGLFMYPSINVLSHSTPTDLLAGPINYPEVGLLLWILTLLLFIARYWLYRRKLKKDLTVRMAVNDERVKLNWLKAYRIAFFVVVGITLFWKIYETGLYPLKWRPLPHPPWLIVFGAAISLVGAFLSYNKGAGREE